MVAEAKPAEEVQNKPDAERLRHRLKDGIVALSLANACLISAWFPLLYDQDKGYFNKALITRAELLALATNILGFALLVWLAMRAMRRVTGKIPRALADLLFVALLIFPFDFCRV